MHAWTEPNEPLRLVQQPIPDHDNEPKALACYGLLVTCPAGRSKTADQVWLRFVKGRPISGITIQYLSWCCSKLEAMGKKALLLIWDNAPWHVSKAVREWIREHNRQVRRSGTGVRIVSCYLPTKSPWLNPIEARWAHAKCKVAEPERTLSAPELADRVCSHCGCTHEPHLALPEPVS